MPILKIWIGLLCAAQSKGRTPPHVPSGATNVGAALAAAVGAVVGAVVGAAVGAVVGAVVGAAVGASVGAAVGASVLSAVGAAVGAGHASWSWMSVSSMLQVSEVTPVAPRRLKPSVSAFFTTSTVSTSSSAVEGGKSHTSHCPAKPIAMSTPHVLLAL